MPCSRLILSSCVFSLSVEASGLLKLPQNSGPGSILAFVEGPRSPEQRGIFLLGSTSAHWSCEKAVSLLVLRYDPHPEGHRAPEVCVPGATKAGKYGTVQKAEQTRKVLKLTLELGELVAKGISVQV